MVANARCVAGELRGVKMSVSRSLPNCGSRMNTKERMMHEANNHAAGGEVVPSHEEEHVAAFRAAKDKFMRNNRHSPLTPEQRKSFQGLSYYPFNPTLVFEVPLDRTVSSEPVVMQTSAGQQQEYHRSGKIHFTVDNTPAELTIYQGSGDDLFLPLRDATSGKETYGAGRYLEPEMLDEDTILVDFNYLYNPYCAYNEQYACPLPPIENWLQVPIRAGEKQFHP